ncbi:cupin domain-containing protein [Candidatus Saccharibacteria bacterium]|nr:cupin domain-containing protein [Candidatus Saccharibacteria bacterium]
MTDHDKKVYVLNMEEETVKNTNFRTTLWTGEHTQLTVMSIPAGSDIGLEVHHVDQFLRVEAGTGKLMTGPSQESQPVEAELSADMAVLIPSGTWHNIVNSGSDDLKVYSLYSPPEHAPGTVHTTKAEADEAEEAEHA